MKKNSVTLGVLAGVCLFVASHASATVVTVKVTGTVYYINGSSFSAFNNGDTFTGVYLFDITQAGTVANNATNTGAYGGSFQGPSWGPFGHVEVMIGDQNYSFDGSFNGIVESSGNRMDQAVVSHDGTANTYSEFSVFSFEYGTFPLDFAQPGDYDISGNSNAGLSIANFSDGAFTAYSYVYAGLQHVEISSDDSIPEPASLSLFVAGLAGAPFFRRSGGRKQNALAEL